MSNPIRPYRLPKKMKSFCRKLRRDSTIPERILWGLLRNRQLDNLKFRRQQAIGPYIVDFFCADAKLVIEVDGDSHATTALNDQRRQQWLETQGLKVLRVTNDDVLNDLESVAMGILVSTERIDDHSPSP